MAERLTTSLAACLACIGASQAHAACRTTAPLEASTAAERPWVDRYNALITEDPYLLSGKSAPRWQALVDDLTRGEATPVELRVRIQMALAGSRKGDAAIAANVTDAQAALTLAEANGITGGSLHAALLAMLAEKETEAGKTAQALAHADAALAETERTDGTESWAYGNAASNAAEAHFANGDYAGAEPLVAIAEQLAKRCLPENVSIIGGEMQSHAAVLSTLGRTDEALAKEDQALVWDVAHLPESDPVLADALEDLGFTLRNANRLREAEAVMRRALDLNARYRPDAPISRATTLGKLGNILVAEGKYREAETVFRAAHDAYARSHDLTNPLAGSGELRRAGDAAQEQGKLAVALDLRRQAIALIESRVQPRHPELARTRIEYAATLVIAHRAPEALAIAEPAAAILRETAPPGDFKRLGAEITYASIAGAAGVDPARAYAAAAPSAAKMEAILLDSATSRGDLIRFAPTFTSSFAAVARLALAAHDDEATFHALQLANLSEIALVNADTVARTAAADPHIRALIEKIAAGKRERQRLDRDRLAANASGNADIILKTDSAIRDNDRAAAETTRALDVAFPAYRTLSRPQPVTLAAFRARLGADDVVLAPLRQPGETLVIAITRDGLRWTTVDATRAATTALITRIRASIDASRTSPRATFDTAAARALGAVLLPPALAPVIDAHRHLIYYVSGPLATVPPALLVTAPARPHAPPAWLIRTHSLSIATSLATRPAGDRTDHAGFLGVGAPTLTGKPLTLAMRGIEATVGDFGTASVAALPPLPYAARELRAMGALFPADRRQVLLGDTATQAKLMSLPLDRFGVIAFATHGLVADALPGLTQPALVLTPTGGNSEANDGLLTVGEIAGLHLDADWVILSACNSAGGSDPQAGSYSGLASAFMQAGARALLVSHWPVRDDAAERITVSTLAATRRGVDRPAALRQAMLALMRDPRMPGAANPAVWAPFVLVDQ